MTTSTFKLTCENVDLRCNKNLVRDSFKNKKQTMFEISIADYKNMLLAHEKHYWLSSVFVGVH